MKDILILIGSKRQHGNTTQLADAFIRGAEVAGHHVTRVHLGQTRVNGCLGCGNCFTADRPCVQEDGMDAIYPAFLACDTIVFATPLYFWTLTAALKAVIERLYAIGSQTNYQLPHKDCVLLATAADECANTFDQLVSYYHDVLIHELKWTDKGMVLAGGCVGTKESTIRLSGRHADAAYALGASL